MSNGKDVITISDSPCSPRASKKNKLGNDKDFILISDSPLTPRAKKRKYETESKDLSPVPKHPLLESIAHRFKHNRDEREAKVAEFHSKREAEKVHSEYLKKYETSPYELARAGYAAGHWAKKNGMKVEMPRTAQSPVSINSRRRSAVKRDKPFVCSPVALSDSPEAKRISLESDSNNVSTSMQESVCPILYCDARFTSVAKLEHHMNLFEHSPCNPCRLIKDGKLKPDPCCYKCPSCDLEFSSFGYCKDHMKAENHLSFMPPLLITAFMCAQCLHMFDTFENCLVHIEQSRHFSVCLPFEADNSDSEFSLPVPVGEEFMQDFISKCKEIKYEVRCMQCDLVPENPRAVREHQKETCNLHVFSAFTEGSITDIISHYLASYNCNVCQRLFHGRDTSNGFHDCYHGIVGLFEEGTASTFAEFIKRCSLTLRKSYKDAEVVCIEDDSDVSPKENVPNVQDRMYVSCWTDTHIRSVSVTKKPSVLMTKPAFSETPNLKTGSVTTQSSVKPEPVCSVKPVLTSELVSMKTSSLKPEPGCSETPVLTSELVSMKTSSLKPKPGCSEKPVLTSELVSTKMSLLKLEPACSETPGLTFEPFTIKTSSLKPEPAYTKTSALIEEPVSTKTSSLKPTYACSEKVAVKMESVSSDTSLKKKESANFKRPPAKLASVCFKVDSVKKETEKCDDKNTSQNKKSLQSQSNTEEEDINSKFIVRHWAAYKWIDPRALDPNLRSIDKRGKRKRKKKKVKKVAERWLDLDPSARRSADLSSSDIVGSRAVSQNIRKRKPQVLKYIQSLLNQAEEQLHKKTRNRSCEATETSTSDTNSKPGIVGKKPVYSNPVQFGGINESTKISLSGDVSVNTTQQSQLAEDGNRTKAMRSSYTDCKNNNMNSDKSIEQSQIISAECIFNKTIQSNDNVGKSVSNFKEHGNTVETSDHKEQKNPANVSDTMEHRVTVEAPNSKEPQITVELPDSMKLSKIKNSNSKELEKMENTVKISDTEQQQTTVKVSDSMKQQNTVNNSDSKDGQNSVKALDAEKCQNSSNTRTCLSTVKTPTCKEQKATADVSKSKEHEITPNSSNSKEKHMIAAASKSTEYQNTALMTTNAAADIIQTHIANDALTSYEYLRNKKNIVFLDLDNYPSFFSKLPHCPSPHTFVWVFYGGGTNINSKRVQCPMFKTMQKKGMVYVHEKCGRTKDAADFALVLTLGKLDVTLPPSVSFTILSADKGFCEVERQMASSSRKAMVINQNDSDEHILLGLLASIAEM